MAFGGVGENDKSLWFEGVDIGDEATGAGPICQTPHA